MTTTAAVPESSPKPANRPSVTFGRALTFVVPAALASAWSRLRARHLLVAAALLLLVGAVTGFDDESLSTIGRVGAWPTEPVLIYIVLALLFFRLAALYSLSTLENRNLAAKLETSLHELGDSRARIQSVADAERRRIERDLHDGAQQRLVALRVKVGLAEELLPRDPAGASRVLHQLGSEADEAIDGSARSHAAFTPLCSPSGVRWKPCARSPCGRPCAPRSTPKPSPAVPRRLRTPSTSCASRRSRMRSSMLGASGVCIHVVQNEALGFEVVDDGPGFSQSTSPPGMGLTNMRDRIAAVGGVLTISSTPGTGTTVTATIPLDRR